jgi:DNA mismatch repair protein MutL
VIVRDLFYNVPARRKFLKSETTELGHIASLATHYALAHPEKSFALKTPTQEIVNVGPVADYHERVFQIFGKQALDELIELKETRLAAPPPPWEGGTEAEEAVETMPHPAEMVVRGFVSKPEVQRPNRNAIYVFVNRRLVRDRLILHAIHEAYRNILPSHTFPSVLLFLVLPFAEVDVNVHPSKVEVRFRHSAWVHDGVREAVRAALMAAKPIASFPSTHRAGERTAAMAAGTGLGFQQAVATDVPMSDGAAFDLEPYEPAAEPLRFAFEPGKEAQLPGRDETAMAEAAISASAVERMEKDHPVSGLQSSMISPGKGSAGADRDIANLKPLGQVNNSFIVAVNASGLWIVDQHAAHERILFERQLREQRSGQVTGQRLLMPTIVQLNPRQQATFDQIAAELRASGFEVEPFGQRTVAVQSAPSGISTTDLDRLLVELLDGVERELQTTNVETLRKKIAASISCHAAIKVNMPLDQRKMEWLLGELAETEYPMSCPHGRPIVLRYGLREIERAFKRV